MNVLVIPSWYPSGKDKLMGIYHKEFCEALVSQNIKVNMLFIERERLNSPIKYLFMKKEYSIEEKGYKTYVKRMLNVDKISYKWQLKRYVKALDKAFKKYLEKNKKPDIIHAMVSIPAGYAACMIGKKYNIPVIITEHASYFKRFFEGKNKEYGKLILNYATFTTVSNYMAEYMKNNGIDCKVLPNLVDTEIFKKNRKKIKELKLITVSALRQGKRIDDIIESLKLLIDKHKNIKAKLTVVGDGFLETYYKNRCHELQMDEYVDFVGRKTKEEISDLLIQHNIFVIASEKETFCIPGIEALASGMPVIATKSLGPEEYIDESCGKLVEVGNPKELAKAIYEVYLKLDKYDVEHLRSIASRYSKEEVANKAIKIYKEILNK